MQTLRQLEQKKGKRSSVAGCEIVDWPAFRIRGFMQDVGRSYISMEELKREIEILSRFKINVFHWHLTENQAWRLESKIFPMLNDSVNTIRMPGKYYTLEEARDLVDFCKKHQVLLIPEIDMPGHSAAFVRAFRHDMQSPEGMKILKLLLDEVCETFDVPYLHIYFRKYPLFVKEMRLELTRHNCHHPLKVARLPIPPFLQKRKSRAIVPRTGLEPACLSTHAPETCASTNSATWAKIIVPTFQRNMSGKRDSNSRP